MSSQWLLLEVFNMPTAAVHTFFQRRCHHAVDADEVTAHPLFHATTKNICSFSEFSRLPSRWPYHKASLFSEAAFSLVHHHYLLVLCRAARITGSCRASSPFSSRPGTEFKHRDLQRGLLKLLPWLFFSTPQLPVLGGNQTATRNASFC